MLRQFGYSAADEELHHSGNSQDQSGYAASSSTTNLPQERYSCATAWCTVVDKNLDSLTLDYTWPTTFRCFDPADVDLTFATGESQLEFGSSLHSPLNTLFSRDCTSSSVVPAQSGYQLVDTTWNHHPYASLPTGQQQSDFFPSTTPPEIRRALASSVPTIDGMQRHLSDPQTRDDYLSEDSGQVTASSTTSRKRSRDDPMNNRAGSTGRVERPSKSMRTGKQSQKGRTSGGLQGALAIRDMNFPDDHQDGEYSNLSAYHKISECLTSKQRKFVRQWVDTFAHSDSRLALSNEAMSALATLIQARPQIVYEYISKTYPSLSNIGQFPTTKQSDTTSPQQQRQQPSEPYSLTTANAHLPPGTLSLVTKYITACRRPRPGTDGRRSVNTGPYRCTFGCGYRTKRAFDWRRHEETHEPQELWLCTFCSQSADGGGGGGKKEPFLVSRKDKFLKHAKEAHKEWTPEKVLELSRVDYKPKGEVGCEVCGWRGEGKGGWDERCRHVLGHFEDEVQMGLRRPRVLSVGGESVEGSREGSVASGSVVSGGSEDGESGIRDRDCSEGID